MDAIQQRHLQLNANDANFRRWVPIPFSNVALSGDIFHICRSFLAIDYANI